MLAGGLGTRVASLTGGVTPKTLLDVAGRPFLDRRIEDLLAEGVHQVIVLAGHGAAQLRQHIDAADFGMEVVTIAEGSRLLGTGGAIAAALGQLPDSFWVTYADTFLQAPMAEIEELFDASGAVGLMTVLRNEDRWQRSNADVAGGLVAAYEKGAPPGTFPYIDYGLLLFRREAFTGIGPGARADLSDVVGPLIHAGDLAAFEVTEPFHDIGTPAALEETARWIADREGRSDAR
jgi:N-acetyl-alpha-D-muramate 1-phosphate uridylyltransferase